MNPKILWLTDPWKKLEPTRETTLRWIQEAISLGFGDHYLADSKSVRVEGPKTLVCARRVYACDADRSALSWKFGATKHLNLDRVALVLYRTDPPVDLSYIHPIQLISLRHESKLINPAQALMIHGEKLETLNLPESVRPKSYVGSQIKGFESFLRKQKHGILKPLNLAQSKGITKVSAREMKRACTAFKQLTHSQTVPIMVQQFLADIEVSGETRLWFLKDRLIAQVRKTLPRGSHLVDIDRGSRVLAHPKLTKRESEAARALAPLLKRLKVEHTAVDLIGGRVTDINFTSPGLIVQMEETLNRNLSEEIVKSLRDRV